MRVKGHSNIPHPRPGNTIKTGASKAKHVAISKLPPADEGHKKMPPTNLSHSGNLKGVESAFKRAIRKQSQ